MSKYGKSKSYRDGIKILKSKYPEHMHKKLLEDFYDFSPQLSDAIISFGLNQVWGEYTQNLTVKEKEMLTLASLITSASAPSQIKVHVYNALNVEVTKQQIKELQK